MLRAAVLVSTVAVGTTLVLAAPAQAASPKASCVGIIVSTLAPAGELDVDDFKAIGEAGGARNFGAFVSEGAHLHEGTLERCLPNVP